MSWTTWKWTLVLYPWLVERLDANHIREVHMVTARINPDKHQFVVVMDDQSYLCTCLTLQNSGYVCKHFNLMQSYGSFKYHPRLILKRWFKDELQDAHNSEERIMSEPFVITYPIIEERATSKIVLIPRT